MDTQSAQQAAGNVISRTTVAESTAAIKTAVFDEVRLFIGEQTVFDDITWLVLKQQ